MTESNWHSFDWTLPPFFFTSNKNKNVTSTFIYIYKIGCICLSQKTKHRTAPIYCTDIVKIAENQWMEKCQIVLPGNLYEAYVQQWRYGFLRSFFTNYSVWRKHISNKKVQPDLNWQPSDQKSLQLDYSALKTWHWIPFFLTVPWFHYEASYVIMPLLFRHEYYLCRLRGKWNQLFCFKLTVKLYL